MKYDAKVAQEKANKNTGENIPKQVHSGTFNSQSTISSLNLSHLASRLKLKGYV